MVKSRTRRSLATSAFIAAVLAGPAHTAPVSVKDATGASVTVSDTSRIVSIGGAVTEILYALGKERDIVAIDSTSLFPARAAAEKKNVGYMRQLSPEGVIGLAPSLILAIEGTGPKETLSVLSSARVPMVLVPDSHSGDGIVDKIDLIARTIDAKERGACLAKAVRADLAALATLRKGIETPRRVMFVLSFMNGRAMVAGRNTAADGIIRMAGGVNAISDYEGYRQVNDEAVVAARPEFVLAMSRSSADPITAEQVFAHPGFAGSPAAASRAFRVMDGLYLLGFGPRTARAARDLALSIYPALKAGAMPSELSDTGAPGACNP